VTGFVITAFAPAALNARWSCNHEKGDGEQLLRIHCASRNGAEEVTRAIREQAGNWQTHLLQRIAGHSEHKRFHTHLP